MKENTKPIKCPNCENAEVTAYEHELGQATYVRLVCVECGADFPAGQVM